MPDLDPGTIVRVLNKHGVRSDTLHLMTTAGPIDIVFAPDGAPSGYADLADDAVSAELDHQTVMVVTVAKWEALKQATGRAKDLEHLDRYYEARRKE